MKQHTGEGLGGVLGLVVWILVSAVSAFVIPPRSARCITATEAAAGHGLDRALALPRRDLIIPAIVWFVKVQGALNRYWESKAAAAAEVPATA